MSELSYTEFKTEDDKPVKFCLRLGTSDERVLVEVVQKKCYRRPSIGFDIQRGERWLDLGANVGAFALYCKIKGAFADCYEPEPSNYEILSKNVGSWDGFTCHLAAVTSEHRSEIALHVPTDGVSHSRPTVSPGKRSYTVTTIPNVCAAVLVTRKYDGVKMDIEGAEGGIIDGWMLPACDKLCLEYHTSRDADAGRLAARLRLLKERFEVVSYPAELDRVANGSAKPFCDRTVFCMTTKKPQGVSPGV